MEVVPKPNTMSDRIKAFLDDPQRPEHIDQRPSTEANQEANFFEYIIMLGFFFD